MASEQMSRRDNTTSEREVRLPEKDRVPKMASHFDHLAQKVAESAAGAPGHHVAGEAGHSELLSGKEKEIDIPRETVPVAKVDVVISTDAGHGQKSGGLGQGTRLSHERDQNFVVRGHGAPTDQHDLGMSCLAKDTHGGQKQSTKDTMFHEAHGHGHEHKFGGQDQQFQGHEHQIGGKDEKFEGHDYQFGGQGNEATSHGEEEETEEETEEEEEETEEGYALKDTVAMAAQKTKETVMSAAEKAVPVAKTAAEYAGKAASATKDTAVVAGWGTAQLTAAAAVEGTKLAAKAVHGVAGYVAPMAASVGHKGAEIAAKTFHAATDVAVSTGETAKEYAARKKEEARRGREGKSSEGETRTHWTEEWEGGEEGKECLSPSQQRKEKDKDSLGINEEREGGGVLEPVMGGVEEVAGVVLQAIGETIVEIAQTTKELVIRAQRW